MWTSWDLSIIASPPSPTRHPRQLIRASEETERSQQGNATDGNQPGATAGRTRHVAPFSLFRSHRKNTDFSETIAVLRGGAFKGPLSATATVCCSKHLQRRPPDRRSVPNEANTLRLSI